MLPRVERAAPDWTPSPPRATPTEWNGLNSMEETDCVFQECIEEVEESESKSGQWQSGEDLDGVEGEEKREKGVCGSEECDEGNRK